jgi:anoctamin-10
MEIIIQFGYVTLFASAYPLASLISIIANLIEMRADAFKITFVCRRPRSSRCDGLNVWKKLLEYIVWLSALTNCLIFGYTSGQLKEWLPHFYEMDDTDHMHFRDDKGWIVIFIIFGLERALICIGLLVNAIIPDIPDDVMNELERKHFVLEQESREFEHQQAQLKSVSQVQPCKALS